MGGLFARLTQAVQSMQHDKNLESVWPGFVAAISCLVLSLLLLASIIVSLITQIGLFADSYREVLVQKTLEKKWAERFAQAKQTDPNLEQTNAERSVTEKRYPPEIKKQIRIVFANDMVEVPLEHRDHVRASILKLSAGPNTRWQVWAHAASTDALAQRTSFQLISAVRNLMIAHGIGASQIQLDLLGGEDVSKSLNPGEIAVYIAPLSLSKMPETP